MENNYSLSLLIDKLGIHTEHSESEEKLFSVLSQYLEHVIQKDFNKLVSILYRIDVSEERVRTALANNKNQPAGQIIAAVLIEREEEKIKTRALYRNK